jgi:hypothetical protein
MRMFQGESLTHCRAVKRSKWIMSLIGQSEGSAKASPQEVHYGSQLNAWKNYTSMRATTGNVAERVSPEYS